MIKKIFSLIIIMTLLAGCTGLAEDTAEPEPAATPVPTQKVIVPQSGGVLKLAMRHPKTLNPLKNDDATVDSVLKLIFEPLAILNDSLKPESNMAASFDFASDGLSVVITLLDNIKWSDGVDITSSDLIYSLDCIASAPESSIYKETIYNISSYIPINNKQVKIFYKQPFSGSSYLLCFPIIPAHYYGSSALDKDMMPLGNSIYAFESYTNMKSMKLVAVENSFKKKPYIDNIEVVIISDTLTELNAFDQSIIDVISSQLTDWGKYRGSKDVHIAEYITTYYDFIGFNYRNTIFNDKRLREAVARCLNINEIIENIYLNHAIRAYSPINPASWLYEPPGQIYNYDINKAKELIKEAMPSNTGETAPLSILVNEENTERIKIANILKTNLETAGLPCEIIMEPFVEYEARLTNKDFDIFIGGFNLSDIPDLTFAFHSSSIPDVPNSADASTGKNYFSYKSDVLDYTLGQMFSAISESSVKRAASEIQKHFSDELPCVSIVFRKSAILADKKVYGDKKPSLGNVFANISDWFIYNE